MLSALLYLSTDLGNGCRDNRALLQGNEGCTVLLDVNASFLVIFVQLWYEELLEHVQIQ
jgi:hypothetical protein